MPSGLAAGIVGSPPGQTLSIAPYPPLVVHCRVWDLAKPTTPGNLLLETGVKELVTGFAAVVSQDVDLPVSP